MNVINIFNKPITQIIFTILLGFLWIEPLTPFLYYWMRIGFTIWLLYSLKQLFLYGIEYYVDKWNDPKCGFKGFWRGLMFAIAAGPLTIPIMIKINKSKIKD